MTKKDFQLIAATIAAMRGPGMWEQRESCARAFADALAPTNPLFKRDLFIQAATGVVAVTARKAKPTIERTPEDTAATLAFVKRIEARTLASDIAEDR